MKVLLTPKGQYFIFLVPVVVLCFIVFRYPSQSTFGVKLKSNESLKKAMRPFVSKMKNKKI